MTANGEISASPNTISDFDVDEDIIGVRGIRGISSVDDLGFNQAGDDTIISVANSNIATLLGTDANVLQTNGTFKF